MKRKPLQKQSHGISSIVFNRQPATSTRTSTIWGVQLDYFFNSHGYITGHGLAAHHGNVGSYMTGLVGAGARLPLVSKWSTELEVLGGAAGGGGLAMGSGLLAQTNLALVYQFTSSLSGQVSVGEAKAINGPFRAHVAGLALAWHERLFERR